MSQDGIQQTTKQGMGGCAKAAIGCGIVCLLIIGAIIAGVTWIANNPRQAKAGILALVLEAAIDDIKIPEDQKAQIVATIERVKQDYIDEKITEDQATRVFQAILESPLFKHAIVTFAEQAYLDKSGLSQEEKSDGKMALRRLVYGATNQEISEARGR